jgi:hypothetical protein
MTPHTTQHRINDDGVLQYRTRLQGEYGENAWSRWLDGDYRIESCNCEFCKKNTGKGA